MLKSKKGEESMVKPIFLFCQGSMAQPLIKIYDNEKAYNVFAFNPDIFLDDYHLAIVSKPCIPLVVDEKSLAPNFVYVDTKTGLLPVGYSNRNLLSYYASRNLKVIDFLQSLKFVSKDKLVVAGHSEGSTVAAKMAEMSKKITNLIYASGDPLGRILSMINKDRAAETSNDSIPTSTYTFDYWSEVVKDKDNMSTENGDTFKATYTFSQPPMEYLKKVKVPVLVTFGTKDWCTTANDFLQIEMIRLRKKNFTFKPYIGLEHNYFPLNKDGSTNYNQFNWDTVALDWRNWLKAN